jgi:hypothetical protein
MADRNSYQIRRATSTDDERVLHMMRGSFFRDEPLNIAVGLVDDAETCPELEQFCLQALGEGTYVLLACKVVRLIGLISVWRR